MLEFAAVIAFAVIWVVVKDRQVAEEREAWAAERRELLNRIQHPEIVQLPVSDREIEVVEPDEIGLVGMVVE